MINVELERIQQSLGDPLDNDSKNKAVEQIQTDVKNLRVRILKLESQRNESKALRRSDGTRSFDRVASPREPVMHDEEATAQLLNKTLSNRSKAHTNGLENRESTHKSSDLEKNSFLSRSLPSLKRHNSNSKMGSPKKKTKLSLTSLDLPPPEGLDDSGDEDYDPIQDSPVTASPKG